MEVRTERLLLVPVGSQHTADLVILHGGPHVAHWYAGRWTRHQAAAWAQAMAQLWRDTGAGKWMAYLESSGELVGRGGLSWAEVDGVERLELGWAIREEHRGHGYATEIGRAGLGYAFDVLGADEVVAFTEVHNTASIAVMVRLGMHTSGLLHRPGLIEGQRGIYPDAPFALYRSARSDR